MGSTRVCALDINGVGHVVYSLTRSEWRECLSDCWAVVRECRLKREPLQVLTDLVVASISKDVAEDDYVNVSLDHDTSKKVLACCPRYCTGARRLLRQQHLMGSDMLELPKLFGGWD